MEESSTQNLSPTKKALLALKQMQQKLEAIQQAKHEAIAVVGTGCRFPGANNPEEFWQLLVQGQDAISEVSAEHWAKNSYCNDGVNTPGKICTARGGFVPHLKEFDASFFRIAPKEAASLDPQQRLLLEVSWEALENAGIAPDSLQGSATGVFIGICGTDYWHQLLNQEPNQIDAYLTTGNTHSLASGRLSHFYGCTAPSLSLDTACSSSLVAVHLAIKSLREKESNLAIAGGVNRLIAPEVSINFSQAKMLSPDGRCKTFDNSANGFVRSEGCGLVILKRLSDAIADCDPIKVVLLGSAVNQDGRTSSITTPNSLSQQAVIRQALANSKIEPQQISYLESHGTGTSLGDLIELEALSSVFKENERLVLGAVKTNIGHLESASGIASLIKTILVLQQQTIPANLHLRSPNEQLDWQDSPFVLPTENLDWPGDEQARFAGVSAFGFSGTNAHVVVAEAPKLSNQEDSQPSSSNLFTLSARNKPALRQLVQDYAEYLANHSELELADICHTVNLGRSNFNHRLAGVVTSIEELQTK
ncbi:MAG: polyketide synthase, partial [Cyanobacteria bacterium J06642_3]